MDCPRCGISVFADHSACRTCGWQLSRPFVSGEPHPAESGKKKPNGHSPEESLPAIQTAADAFALSPPRRNRRAQMPRRLRRRRTHAHPEGGVATLPAEARWEAPARYEVIEMPSVQSAFDFPAAELEAERLVAHAVAPLAVRARSGLLDAALVVLAASAFFGLFALLSGHVSLVRRDLLVYLLAAFTLSVLYFGLFTLLGGRTPGMQYYGLRAVTFEGNDLAPAQAVRRAFGYVVSTGSLLLGFLWAVVDERHLTWHDRISHTFLTHHSKL